jgi:uncharacterized phiE125 gp8 family phage protein
MWYQANITSPASAVVSLADAKAHVRVDHADDDAYITGLVAAATDYVEFRNTICIGAQTLAAECDQWSDFCRLPSGPVNAVSLVSYIEGAGAAQTLSSTVYELVKDGLEASIKLKYGQVWPSTRYGSRITTTFTAGHATVPPVIVHAIKLLVSHWYENREPATDAKATGMLADMVDDLLCNHRRGV